MVVASPGRSGGRVDLVGALSFEMLAVGRGRLEGRGLAFGLELVQAGDDTPQGLN